MQHEAQATADAVGAHPDWREDDHLLAILARNAGERPREVAMRERERGIWKEYSWAEYLERVLAFAAGLEAAGVGPADLVVVIGDNRSALYMGMLGAICLRAVPSPAYPDTPAEELRGQIAREGVRAAIAEDQEQVDKLLAVRETHPELGLIVYDDPRGLEGMDAEGLVAFTTLVERGRGRLHGEPGLRDELCARASVHDTAVLLHSSGTTGTPKGVPLRHGHLLAGVRNAAAAGYFRTGEVHMAYLPLAWVGDFIFSVAAALELRFVVNIPEAQETALHDLREIAPTLYFSSPRAWSAMLTRIQVGVGDSTPLKRRLYAHFMPFAVALERARLAGHEPGPLQRLRYALGTLLIFAPLRDRLGLSRVERAYTAGEAIGEDVFLFFRALGLNLRQFYGQTENVALAAAQAPDDISLDTVGRPFPGVEIRIDATGEILMRGENVFDGYLDNPEATRETLADGWLHTGDAGQFNADGELVVLGRVSEVVHTAAGVRFIPTYLENRLKFSQFLRDVAIIGSGRPFLCAIVCIDIEAAGQWAQENGVAYTSYAELSQKPEILDLTAGVIGRLNAMLPEGLAIARFVNLHKAFDPDDGEVTRTRKLRRRVIEDRYAPIIEAIYDGRDEVDFDARIAYETGETGTITRRLAIRSLPGRGA